MADGPDMGPPRGTEPETIGVSTLASRVLTVVSSRVSPGRTLPDAEILDLLQAFVVQRDDRERFLARIDAAGIPLDAVADIYVPAVARGLGEAWLDDSLSFADVTIGTARLQRLLRDLGPEWRSDSRNFGPNEAILIIVPQGADHILGPTLLSGQLRRLGFAVRLVLGENSDEITRILNTTAYKMVMISSAGCDRLAKLQKLVKVVRRSDFAQGPLVLGGACLDYGEELERLTDVDCFTSDPFEALNRCGLADIPKGSEPRPSGA